MAIGMYSTWIPIVTIVAGIIASFGFAGGSTDFSHGVYGRLASAGCITIFTSYSKSILTNHSIFGCRLLPCP